jgi:endonuclease/exonuclease/phosphatase family metal-dependent hydrolase
MPTPFAVATWNVENFFPAGTASGPTTKAVYRRKVAYLAKTINGIAPDVVALQEVGDPSTLGDLQRAVGGAYRYTAISTFPDERGIRVAFLARRNLTGVRQMHAFPPGSLFEVPDPNGHVLTTMGRGMLQATVSVAGIPIRLATAHLKSKLLTFPGGRRYPRNEDERARGAGYALLRRAAEATAVRVHLNSVMTNDQTPTILCGDMNDEPIAVTTELLQGPPDADPDRPDKGDDVRMTNLADFLPVKHHYSRIFRRQPELIDHIFISQDLVPRVRQVDSLVSDISSITQALKPRRDATVPDHASVFARFELE